ncbi:LuxR C-terminal-related transcriptional regulator [Georgenia muralis]|uniref:LuxR C-terminal-related transcriptional regulator n=1 Tax=Georgenia muralis TaxID=154117 RepID=UPI000F4E7BB6|nr:LuxR C-terminal-related transcriptional regulator [Georgenia muralis]
MPTPVLATKLFAPARRSQVVERPRLTAQLDATLDAGHRLTLVSAPAGFGKTTALSDWLVHLARRQPQVRVAWLSLDDADNDLTRLMTHVVASLDGAGLGVDPAVLEALHTGPPATALTAFVNDVTRAGGSAAGKRWVLVLDDYHVIEASDVLEAVAFLLEHVPDHLRLVVATRSDPPLPLARLRTSGRLTEVRAADLRFRPDEARELLNRAMGLDLTPADVDALEGRTEGWVAGLQLAALSLRGMTGPGEVAGFVEAFTGSNRFVIDYLADEVLARQDSWVRDFLLDTAVLDRLTGPLCDAVTGRADGTSMLVDLERANLFLVPLDTDRRWYRYHHLFADVLQARLRADRPDRVPGLHQRAGVWLGDHGLVEDAVRHTLAAGDVGRAAHLMETALPELRRNRRDGVLLSWVPLLPEAVVRRSPVLSILSGWSLMMSGDLDGAEARFDDAEVALAAGAVDPGLAAAWADTDDLRTAPAILAVYRASLAQARGDVAGTVRHARRALELARPGDHFVRGAGAGFLGLAAWAAGDVREALSTFSGALHSLRAAGNLVDELDGTVVLADMWVATGRPGRARRLCEQALQTATDGGHPYLRAAADLHVALAELDREIDELAGAEVHLETARVLGERTSITENRHRWFVAMSQVRAARGDHESAAALLDQAELLYRHGFYPDLRPIAAMRARVHIGAGDLAAARAWAERRGIGVGDDPDLLREYEHLTLARLLLADHRAGRHDAGSASPAEVLGLLDRLHTAAVSDGREGSVLEIRVLQALAHDAHGDLSSALARLGRALGEAPEPDSHVRLYLDEGAPVLALLDRLARLPEPTAGADDEAFHGEGGEAVPARARRLLERVRTVELAEPAPPLVEPLSHREVDVLRLLATELTGPEIARELYITVNTLRTHTKHIFTKLDARTRAAAVRRARERGLLQPPLEPPGHRTVTTSVTS